MGQISGTYTEYKGASIALFAARSTDGQSGSSLSGSGYNAYGYTIYYTENGYTDTGWSIGIRYLPLQTLQGLEEREKYDLAATLINTGRNDCARTWSETSS